MKLELTDRQWRDIQISLLMAVSYTEKSSKIKFEDNPLIKKYMKIHDTIANAMEMEKNGKS
tara:strand:- start:570 stop:752 length:183 start_codon:yes stop_codon:yes gene_type:complete